MTDHREAPIKRTNPSGAIRWIARWTDKTGKRRIGHPPTIKGTYKLKRDAQEAINACYELDRTGPARQRTVGSYYETWLTDHPRADRTAETYRVAVNAVLDVPLEGTALRDWLMSDVRRSHAKRLVTVLLVDHGRSANGARNILNVLQTMWQDAIDDEYVPSSNPFSRMRLRSNDPRIRTPRRENRVWTWEQMHAFAAAAPGPYGEAMVRVLADCGLRLGEMLALERRHRHEGLLEVRQTAWKRQVSAGTKTDHGERDAGRTVPLAPSTDRMLASLPPRLDSPFLFPARDGGVWSHSWFYERLWYPTKAKTGMDPRPHEFRHSHVSLVRAAGVDPADLAAALGHTIGVASRVYTHALGRSYDQIRAVVEHG